MKNRPKKIAVVFICLVLLIACKLPKMGAPKVSVGDPQLTKQTPLAEATRLPAETRPAAAEPLDSPDTSGFGTLAREHMAYLSQKIGPRIAGTESETRAANTIRSVLDDLGYETQIQPFRYENQIQTPFFRIGSGDYRDSQNVLALKQGASEQMIVVGAHYDSSGEAGSGAEDNASGVGVLLELASRVSRIETPYTITFIAFGAEEVDLDGSSYYVDHLSKAEKETLVAYINLDSVSAGTNVYLYGDEKNSGNLAAWLAGRAERRGFTLYPLAAGQLDEADGTRCECSDYDAFQLNAIPFVYFEASDWTQGDQDGWTQVEEQYGDNGVIIHTAYDDLNYLDQTFPGRIAEHLNVVVTLAYDALTEYRVK